MLTSTSKLISTTVHIRLLLPIVTELVSDQLILQHLLSYIFMNILFN